MIRRASALALFAGLVWAAPAAALALGPEAPHSPNTEDMSTAYWVMIVLTSLIALAVNGALIGAIVRFRARRGRLPDRITAGRGAVGRVAGALGVLALGLFIYGLLLSTSARSVDESGPAGLVASASQSVQVPIRGVSPAALEAADTATLSEETEGGVFKPAAGDPLVIDAIAQQWLWRFEYPGGTPGQRTFSYGELVVPVDTAVVLEIDSTDVIHSWWVPALTGQVQAVPGGISRTWFKADEVGTYLGRGTVFDGTSYPSLTARVTVVEATEYEAYVEGLTEDLQTAQDAVAAEVSAAAEAQAEAEEGAPDE